MSNIHFGLILNVNSQLLVIFVLLGDTRSQVLLFVVVVLDLWLPGLHVGVFLATEGVHPNIFRLDIVCQHVCRFVTEIFFSQFQGSFDFNLFHATIFWYPLDV